MRILSVVLVVVLKDAKIGGSKDFLRCPKNQTVLGSRHRGFLSLAIPRSVEVHENAAIRLVHVDFKRGDVADKCGRLLETQGSRFVYAPWALNRVRVSWPNELSVVMSEVEIVFPQWISNPIGDADQGGPLISLPKLSDEA